MRQLLQVIETSRVQALPVVVVGTDHERIIVNMPETFQRHMSELKIGLPKNTNVLFTRVDVETTGGLFGFLLSASLRGMLQMKVYGPPGLSEFFSEARYLLGSKVLQFSFATLPEGHTALGVLT
jgi:ribonuclease Z